jgi:hypothetical protein
MSVGLPGSGIGGVFYILSALWMPVHNTHRTVRGDHSRMRVVMRQGLMAALILSALWGTGFVIDIMLSGPQTTASLREAFVPGGDSKVPHVFQAASFLLTFGTLAGVLLMVQLLRFVVPQRPVAAPEPRLEDDDRKAA